MTMPFSADEVFEMAEEIEHNGAKFYRAAAEKFPKVGEAFVKLAAMEDEHEATFKAMRAELSETETGQPVYDPDGEAGMYLRVMADEHVFNIKDDPEEKLGRLAGVGEVIAAAIETEKDSIAFYTGLKECVSAKAGKDKVEAIIKEEFRHIGTLNKMAGEL